MEVNELLDEIRKLDVVLPEFQREFVWDREQAKQLVVSLMKRYPVGSLLFWKTDSPPEIKNLDVLPEKLGTIKVILDGQQRLTTLYLLLVGEIPPYYTSDDVENDPRNLYFHIETGDLQYYQSTRMEKDPLWLPVVECFRVENTLDDINVFQLAQWRSEQTGQQAMPLAQTYSRNLSNLRAIKRVDLPVQTVPSDASINDAIDVFDRVNSQGTKLTDAELALTHVTGRWPQARRELKSKLAELGKRNFLFDLTFMTRALVGVVTKRGLFSSIHTQPADKVKEGWEQLTKILDYIVTIFPKKAHIDSTRDLTTTNILVPIVVYLSLNDGHFPSQKAMMQAFHWFYAAHIWQRYSSQTDQKLEQDLSLIGRNPANPWPELINQIIDQRGRLEVNSNDLEGRGISHPLYKMMITVAKAHGAVDWFNGAPLGSNQSSIYNVHHHYIFPRELLYQNGFDPTNHLHKKIVNEIANRAALTATTNMDLSNVAPRQYLPDVQQRFQDALVSQFIPMNPELWEPARFEDFLQARRKLITTKINEFMNSLITELEPVADLKIIDLIALGESASLEFKSTFQWDVVQNQINKDLRFQVLKTIAAFMNSDGGTLVIGVEDNGNIFGLERDLATMQNSLDKFEQALMNLVDTNLGGHLGYYLHVRFEEIDGHSICAVDVDKAAQPVFMKKNDAVEFHVRMGNTTRALDPQETTEYVQMNWE